MSYLEKEKLIKADIASIENRVRHAFNQGYDLGYKDGKANCSKNSTGSNTNNDLAQERYQDLIEYFGGEDVVLNDRKMFMAWLDRVRWYVKRVDELARELEQLKETTNNDLAVDAISRIETIDYLCKHCPDDGECFKDCDEIKHLRELPSVTPQEPRCKECKWWKDSDGEYRRGVNAESQCPINRKEVYEGNGYCFLYEPQESEDKE